MQECKKHLLNVVVSNKYTVRQLHNGELHALRNGVDWRDCVGDNLILTMAQRIEELQDKIIEAQNCFVASAIGDPMEVCQTTLGILDT